MDFCDRREKGVLSSTLPTPLLPPPNPPGSLFEDNVSSEKIQAQKWVKDVGLLRGNFPNSPFKRGSRRLSKQRQSGLDHTEEDFSLT